MIRSVSRLSAFVPIMISILLGSLECRAQSATAEALSPPILPANTPVILRLTKNLYKKDAKPGQPVEFAVGSDVVVNGQVFIQSGAAVTGKVRHVDRTGKGPAKVLVDLGIAQTITGETVRLVGPGTTASGQPFGVADAVSAAGETGALVPVFMPVFVVMSLFEKKVLLDKDAWGGVQVVAHVAENVALDPAKVKAAQEQYSANRKAAHGELCEWLVHPDSGRDGDRIWTLMNEGGFADIGQARTLHQAGDLDGAIRMYQQLLASEAEVSCPVGGLGIFSGARLHFELAELYREKRDFVRAIPEYRTAEQLDPKNEDFRISLVNALEDSGDPDAALAEIKEAMRMWPNNVFFHYLLGKLQVRRNDPDDAIVELQWVLKQEKNHDWRASCSLGRAYELKGDLKAALGQYRTAHRVLSHPYAWTHEVDNEQCRAAYERLQLQLKK